jgi:hypothetical protein
MSHIRLYISFYNHSKSYEETTIKKTIKYILK